MKLIVAYIKPFKLEEVMVALSAFLPSGATVTEVRGNGRESSGRTGRPHEPVSDLLPKVKLEIAVPERFAEQALQEISRAAHTGRPGDGVITVIPIEEVVRIRTGERGDAAL